jgi:hypothetical protein
MTAVDVNDAWMETCLIAISKVAGGSDLAFAGLTETVDFDLGEKDIEGIPLVNGGRVTKFSPEGDKEITFEAYPIQAGTDTGAIGKGFYDLMHTVDPSVPIRIVNDRNRDMYRILVLWTNDSTATTAQSATAANYWGLRIGLADGYFTSVKPSFTDGVLKFTVKYKCAAFDKAGAGCCLMESAAGSVAGDILPVIAAYTTANKFG